jgi:agmatine deiminase
MAPDWAPHARCWMAWPCREAPWGGGLDDARRDYAEVAQAIARFEPVAMIARPELVAMASLYCGPGISTLSLPHDDGWVRDVGPSFLANAAGELAGVTWGFNGWGEVHPGYAQDADLARRILEHVGARRYVGGMVLEGGAIQVDGEGTCIAGVGPVLDSKRNPGLTRTEAEAELMRGLGVETVIWLPAGLVDDEAGGHVDNVAVFARPGLVLALATDDRSDAAFGGLAENLDVLRGAVDARGRTLEVVTVPQPKARDRHDGRRLPLSHLNCYLANEAVIMPSFGDSTDKPAAKAFATAWPDREIVPVDALDLVQGGGGIHGITLGQPAT